MTTLDPIATREHLARQIADTLRRGQHYMTTLEPSPQAVTDIRWAAMAAARILGYRTIVHCDEALGTILVSVTPIHAFALARTA